VAARSGFAEGQGGQVFSDRNVFERLRDRGIGRTAAMVAVALTCIK
jgi:hypothetical protein